MGELVHVQCIHGGDYRHGHVFSQGAFNRRVSASHHEDLFAPEFARLLDEVMHPVQIFAAHAKLPGNPSHARGNYDGF